MIQAIVFFPLIGALIAGLLGRVIGVKAVRVCDDGAAARGRRAGLVVFLPYVFVGGEASVDAHTAPLKVRSAALGRSRARSISTGRCASTR